MDSIDKEHSWHDFDLRRDKLERAALRERVMVWLCRIGILAFLLSLPWGLSKAAEPADWATVQRSAAQLGVAVRAFSLSVEQLQAKVRALRVDVEIPLHVYEAEGTVIRLMPGPCVEPRIVGFITSVSPDDASRFRAIESTWAYRDGQRKSHAGCWAEFSGAETGGG